LKLTARRQMKNKSEKKGSRGIFGLLVRAEQTKVGKTRESVKGFAKSWSSV